MMIVLWSRQISALVIQEWRQIKGSSLRQSVCVRLFICLSVLRGINCSLNMLLKDIFQTKWASQGKNEQFNGSQVSKPPHYFRTEFYQWHFFASELTFKHLNEQQQTPHQHSSAKYHCQSSLEMLPCLQELLFKKWFSWKDVGLEFLFRYSTLSQQSCY